MITKAAKLIFVLFLPIMSADAWAFCTQTPPAEAVRQAEAYYKANQGLIENRNYVKPGNEPGKKIVINDYSKTPPMMYVFSTAGLNGGGGFFSRSTGVVCEHNMKVNYGNGAGGSLVPGCEDSSHLTPPGFHITSENGVEGKKYPFPEGLGMVSCHGQNSFKRAILIHATARPTAGFASSWGCSSLTQADFKNVVQKDVRGGSLVYNYFGSKTSLARNCPQSEPSGNTCTPENNGLGAFRNGSGSSSGGQGSPSRWRR